MSELKLEVIGRRDVKGFDVCGQGVARFYVDDDERRFGTFTLLARQKGGVDKGHPRGEVFYVHQGRMLVFLPGLNLYKEVEEGDAIVVPPDEDHQLINISDETLVTTFLIPLH